MKSWYWLMRHRLCQMFYNKYCCSLFNHLHNYFIQQQLSNKLKHSPDTFEDLKSVLSTISDIRDMSLDVEMRLRDIQERYRTLAMYKVEVLCVIVKLLSLKAVYIVSQFELVLLFFRCVGCRGWIGSCGQNGPDVDWPVYGVPTSGSESDGRQENIYCSKLSNQRNTVSLHRK